MEKRKYLIIGLGVYIIFSAIIGIRENLLSGLPYAFKIINWILMLAYLGVGIFLIKLDNWARIAAVFCAFINFGFVLLTVIIIHQKHSLLDAGYIQRIFSIRLVLYLIVNLFTIYYLSRPKVKELFK